MAVQIVSRVQVNRPIDEVFGVIADIANHPQWAGSVAEIRHLSHNPVQLGTTFVQVSKFLGVEVASQSELIVFDPPFELVGTSAKPLPGQVHWHTEESEDGTLVELIVDLDPQGFLKMAEPVLKNMVQSQLDKDLANLKALLEG